MRIKYNQNIAKQNFINFLFYYFDSILNFSKCWYKSRSKWERFSESTLLISKLAGKMHKFFIQSQSLDPLKIYIIRVYVFWFFKIFNKTNLQIGKNSNIPLENTISYRVKDQKWYKWYWFRRPPLYLCIRVYNNLIKKIYQVAFHLQHFFINKRSLHSFSRNCIAQPS